ncbi:MAG: ferrochelatase [Rickettsiales bacterium]|jgi:ferrochelatase|nr:ferrochelatase [Rickettsiales bacterium]
MRKTAVILFNLGGPDNLKAVRPFLFNLFNDKAIIRVPQPFRWLLASLISWRRSGKAKGIYQQMGGKSPIQELTLAQAEALETQLKRNGEYKVFVSQRYWHPMSGSVARNVKAYAPDQVILLPLYPQFSTTTTASSFSDWDRSAQQADLKVSTARVCCYPQDFGFIASHVRLIKDVYWKAAEHGTPRVLFSAHGLPEKVILDGDPYQWQVEKTVASIVQVLAVENLDFRICYQSRVGPMKWIGPSTEEEIEKAGHDKVPIVVVPVAFVSEHSETLVELDVEYRELAKEHGVPDYWRVPALGTDSHYIEALADLCLKVNRSEGVCSFNKDRFCLRDFEGCPCK